MSVTSANRSIVVSQGTNCEPSGVAVPPGVVFTVKFIVGAFSKFAIRVVSLRKLTRSGFIIDTISPFVLVQLTKR